VQPITDLLTVSLNYQETREPPTWSSATP
jgi:hypothetical protein